MYQRVAGSINAVVRARPFQRPGAAAASGASPGAAAAFVVIESIRASGSADPYFFPMLD